MCYVSPHVCLLSPYSPYGLPWVPSHGGRNRPFVSWWLFPRWRGVICKPKMDIDLQYDVTHLCGGTSATGMWLLVERVLSDGGLDQNGEILLAVMLQEWIWQKCVIWLKMLARKSLTILQASNLLSSMYISMMDIDLRYDMTHLCGGTIVTGMWLQVETSIVGWWSRPKWGNTTCSYANKNEYGRNA